MVSLRADPSRRKSQEILADIENQKGNWESSREILLKTMRLSGDETATLAAIGRKLVGDARQASQGGDLSRAERTLRRAAVLVPESGGIALELAQVLAERNMKAAALLWAERAHALDGSLTAALFFAGNLAQKMEDPALARRYYGLIPASDPLHEKASERISQLQP